MCSAQVALPRLATPLEGYVRGSTVKHATCAEYDVRLVACTSRWDLWVKEKSPNDVVMVSGVALNFVLPPDSIMTSSPHEPMVRYSTHHLCCACSKKKAID